MVWFEQIFNFSLYTKFSNTEHLSCDLLQVSDFNDWTGWAIQIWSRHRFWSTLWLHNERNKTTIFFNLSYDTALKKKLKLRRSYVSLLKKIYHSRVLLAGTSYKLPLSMLTFKLRKWHIFIRNLCKNEEIGRVFKVKKSLTINFILVLVI